MKILKTLGLLSLFALSGFARGRQLGFCEDGGKTVTTLTQVSTTKVQQSFPGCTVTVYNTGTLVLASIFSDNFGTVLANPFTADVTSGQWGFFADDGAYDVRTSAGGIVTPFTRTGLSVYDGTPSAQGTTGTVIRTAKDKLAEVLSVKDFGAKGDGSTDDTVAINLALNVSLIGKGSTPGVCISFPTGIYRITSALSYNHTICAIGDQWRLKYTAPGTIANMFSLIGDPSGTHASLMEGSEIRGMILDGQGNATNGLLLQGVVTGQINGLRVTNVTGAGIVFNWAQQVTCEHCQVSADFEPFTTAPTNGVVIGSASATFGDSADNIFNALNIDHVTGDGVIIYFGSGNVFTGGTSEGNGGRGVYCAGSFSPFRFCIGNQFNDFDTEANGGDDFTFTDLSYMNTLVAVNSFSTVSVHFTQSSHGNTVLGGFAGASKADAGTFGNKLVGTHCILITGSCWTDLGQNENDQIYNQSTAGITAPANNWHKTSTKQFIAGAGTLILQGTPDANTAYTTYGNATNWVGLYSNPTNAWLRYAVGGTGLTFMSEVTQLGTDVADGSILNHNWCFGKFCATPAFKFHFFDASLSTLAVQAGVGQGGADLAKYLSFAGVQLSGVGFNGIWNGPVGTGGSQFTVTGCGANSLVSSGGTAGQFSVTTTGACIATITMGGTSPIAAPHFWTCSSSNDTTANLLRSLRVSTTQVALAGTTVSGDILTFGCQAY